jgi:hypothetical protein
LERNGNRAAGELRQTRWEALQISDATAKWKA